MNPKIFSENYLIRFFLLFFVISIIVCNTPASSTDDLLKNVSTDNSPGQTEVRILTDPVLPMLWRDVIFTPDVSRKTTLNFSDWTLGNKSISKNGNAKYQFTEPGNYIVYFNGTDKKGAVYHGLKVLNLTTKPGDLLFAFDKNSRLTPGEFNRIALVIGMGEIITIENGIVNYSIAKFLQQTPSKVLWGRVKNVTNKEIQGVIKFVKDKQKENPPFDYTSINPLHLDKQTDGPTWYCSELIWAAYLNATNGRIDLDSGTATIPKKYSEVMKGDAVLTDEIHNSQHLEILGQSEK